MDAANIEIALSAAMNHGTVVNALGLSPQQSAEENWEALRPLWSELPDSPSRRHELSRAVASHTFEFRQHGIDFGYSYQSAAIVEDGTSPPTPVDAVRIYDASVVGVRR